MATRAVHIRARTPPPDHDSPYHGAPPHRGIGSGRRHPGSTALDDDSFDQSGWDASTGSAQARNRERLSRTRFVKEGEKSRPWTGNWVVTPQDATSQGQPPDSSEKQHTIDDQVARVDVDTAGGMASFYAHLAATLKSPVQSASPQVQDSTATPSPPTLVTSERHIPKRKKGGRIDWFSETGRAADVQSGSQGGVRRKMHPSTTSSLPPGGSSTQIQHHPKVTGSTTSSTLPSGPSILQCPTCSTPLPHPCPPAQLRAHLTSIVHRLSLPHLPPPPPSTSSSSRDHPESDNVGLPKLHLDGGNRGYRLLSEMGWREGMGVGRSEWEWLELQRQQMVTRKEDKDKEGQREREGVDGKLGEVIEISSSDSEQEEADLRAFLTDQTDPDEIDDVFLISPPSPPPPPPDDSHTHTQESNPSTLTPPPPSSSSSSSSSRPQVIRRPRPRLIPIIVSEKHDRAGLGLQHTPRHRHRDNVARSPSTSTCVSTSSTSKRLLKTREEERYLSLRRKERERRERKEREDWIGLRESLR